MRQGVALLGLLGIGVVAAAVGVALLFTPLGIGEFAAGLPRRYAVYSPVDPFWLTWSRPIGVALVALGAGTTGAVAAALLRRPP